MPSSLDLAGRLAGVVAVQQEILNCVTDVDRVLQLVVERTAELTEASGAAIELVDEDELFYRAASGLAARHIGFHLPMDGSLSGHVVRTKTVLRCEDCRNDSRVDQEACRIMGIRSMIIAPLIDGDRAVGVLNSMSDHVNGFNDLDAYVIQLLAGIASSALQQARAFQEQRASEERYRMLFEQNVTGVFRSTRDGRILDCNDALVKYFGYGSREEFMQQPTWNLYEDRGEREGLLASLMESPAMTNVRLHFKRKDGSPITAFMNVSLLSMSGGDQLLGTIVSAE
jgi:PAS domain S-box-containing protein